MKTRLAFLGFAAITLLVLLSVRSESDEPQRNANSLTFETSVVGQQLIDTLELSYEQRLTQYKLGRTTPGRLIELNHELFDAQIGSVASSQRRRVADNFVSRAQTIEGIAKSNIDNGIGSTMDLLDAKASRLRATLELAKHPSN